MVEAGVKVQLAVRALKGLAEPTRLRLLALLGHGELTVGEVCRVLGQSQPRVSRHLRLLTEAGFLDRFREQQCVYYRTPATGARSRWVHELLAAIDTVLAGGTVIERDIASEMAVHEIGENAYLRPLTQRDLEILRLLAEGNNLNQIADALGIAYKTVANTCTQLKAKLGVRTLTTWRTRIAWTQVEIVAALIDNHETTSGVLQHLQAKATAPSFVTFACG